MARAIDVANYIVSDFLEKGRDINNLKLQKLLYYSEAEHLIRNSSSLFEEDIEKWKLGPVVPEVYHEFKNYGSSNINETASTITIPTSNDIWNFKFEVYDSSSIDLQEKESIDAALIKYGDKDPFTLVDLTHEEPMWKRDEQAIIQGIKHLKYDRDEIYDYFKEKESHL